MTLIVVEGVDGSGKSTFVDELSHQLPDDTVTMHRGPLKRHPLEEYVISLERYNPLEDSVLCDRWQVGELVYGPLYRGSSKLSAHQDLYVNMFLVSRGAVRLIMDTPYETVNERLGSRGEDFLQPQHVRLVHDFYDEYAEANKWGRVRENYERIRLARSIQSSATENAYLAGVFIPKHPSFVGHPFITTLIVVPPFKYEDPHGRLPRTVLAGIPFEGTTGDALMRVVAGIQNPHEIGFVSSDDKYLDDLVCNLSDVRTVIAVGTPARTELRNMGVEDIRYLPLLTDLKGQGGLYTFMEAAKEVIL